MKNLKKIYFVLLITCFNSIAFAQKTLQPKDVVDAADAKDLNILIKLELWIDYALLAFVSAQVFYYFVDFQTERAFVKMLPIAFSVFMAFHWRIALGWFGLFGV